MHNKWLYGSEDCHDNSLWYPKFSGEPLELQLLSFGHLKRLSDGGHPMTSMFASS